MSDTIDEKLSIVIWVTSAAIILSYFLIAASYANGFETFKTETSGALFLAGIIGFLTIMIEAVIFQQKCVCLLYTSDAADEEDSVDFGGRRIIQKKKKRRKGK